MLCISDKALTSCTERELGTFQLGLQEVDHLGEEGKARCQKIHSTSIYSILPEVTVWLTVCIIYYTTRGVYFPEISDRIIPAER